MTLGELVKTGLKLPVRVMLVNYSNNLTLFDNGLIVDVVDYEFITVKHITYLRSNIMLPPEHMESNFNLLTLLGKKIYKDFDSFKKTINESGNELVIQPFVDFLEKYDE